MNRRRHLGCGALVALLCVSVGIWVVLLYAIETMVSLPAGRTPWR